MDPTGAAANAYAPVENEAPVESEAASAVVPENATMVEMRHGDAGGMNMFYVSFGLLSVFQWQFRY